MNGWVKYHRKIKDWEWYSDINVRVLFLHLLISVNYEDGYWRGKLIKKGQLLTGRKSLSRESGLSQQQLRTALKKLCSSNDITVKASNEDSLITVVQWDSYQHDKQPMSNNQSTSHTFHDQPAKHTTPQQAEKQLQTTNANGSDEIETINQQANDTTPCSTINQQPNHYKEVKKLRNKEKDSSSSSRIPYKEIMELFKTAYSDTTIPSPKGLTDKRKTGIKKIWDTYPEYQKLEAWAGLFDYLKQSDFLMNRKDNPRGTPFKIDFLLNMNNFVKLIEGNYDND